MNVMCQDDLVDANSINRSLIPLAEALAPAHAWATDEPMPDLTHLWQTSRAAHGYVDEPKTELELALRAVAKFVGSANTKYIKAARAIN